ncbi:hypothetical protein GUITHDRAFT_104256 [Guillardia theta CCMP2712]|uniref:Uncharacterized protein n=1 Tax=Guillardia theta (strain CCMP2712) TaxID=905079 RepID=L1I646_GUITC|nr:hypothetical protein GUITHDRAFT_122055 [Guillardia theta CCMP2712]XP_005836841.1 hypothetical protein GUITHDRAFT_104256 [Guillardia theta CCMP2712]EKX31738.1 hypothetical protein GUITHDRAFT_122055 [Guillardia theta CCMP2712]EKX49861.1 hypothetical protein GUITHDRAFT_104256 [Guillardia theta CCMP2712]|eukprot:XP_005818718.1 hypothetical protein GUITHDRAFT_122055 [Guillardia theta CCMP2712]
MQFKGDGEQRMVEIIKCVMQYNDGAIFEWGKKEKTLKEAQEALNGHPVFAGQLKLNTLKDKWRKIEKQAEEIANGGEEKWVKLWQNGGGELSEMHQLMLDLAGRMKAMKDRKEREKRDAQDEENDARERLQGAMETTAKRCGYNIAAQTEQCLTPSPEPADPSSEEDNSVQKTRKKNEQGGSYGRGTSCGLQKRAKQDPALYPNGKGPNRKSGSPSSDHVAGVLSQQDRLCDLLESSQANDRAVMEQFGKAQVLKAEADIIKAQAERIKAEATRSQRAADAMNAFLALHDRGVNIPDYLVKMLKGND